MKNWQLFHGDGRQPQSIKAENFPPPPPWRQFKDWENMDNEHQEDVTRRWQELQELGESPEHQRGRRKGETFRLSSTEEAALKVTEAVNAAIYLRRPLLVTGNPGSGKSSLAYAIAYELKLGPVLSWPITARSYLEDGLYRYDAMGRLQDIEGQGKQKDKDTELDHISSQDIGEYITLGPVGTAFLPSLSPRVLLIDEIDKSDINLPNDLLNLFEEGWFRIPQLVRLAKKDSKPVKVQTADKGIEALISQGQVTCCQFPIVVMTSNGEREFPPAFLRRCLRVKMPEPQGTSLRGIIESHFKDNTQLETYQSQIEELIQEFGNDKDRATDQLLNMIYLITQTNLSGDAEKTLRRLILKSLSGQDDE